MHFYRCQSVFNLEASVFNLAAPEQSGATSNIAGDFWHQPASSHMGVFNSAKTGLSMNLNLDIQGRERQENVNICF